MKTSHIADEVSVSKEITYIHTYIVDTKLMLLKDGNGNLADVYFN